MRIAAIGGPIKEPILQRFTADLDNRRTLIIPSACSTENSYGKKVPVCAAMLGELGLETTVLHGYNQVPTQTAIDHEFNSAGLIYVIGGNSPYMFRRLAEHKTNAAIVTAIKNGVSLAGTSAGADPHPTQTNRGTRLQNFERTFPTTAKIGFAIENSAALVIDGDTVYAGRSKPDANVYVVEHTIQGETHATRVQDDIWLTEVVLPRL